MPVRALFRRVPPDLIRYFFAALLALTVDTATLSICLRLLHLGLGWSVTLGFAAGATASYVLSIRWVFQQRSFANAPIAEFATFVGIGIIGLVITQLVLWVGVTQLGLIAEVVKLAAAVITFFFNYLTRKAILFAASRRSRSVPETMV